MDNYLKFSLTFDQSKLAEDFIVSHKCSLRSVTTAIGGQFTHQFTNTSIGQVQKIVCACGEEEDLTDYATW